MTKPLTGRCDEGSVPEFRVVEFQLLQDCNLKCVYCGYNQPQSKTSRSLPLSCIEKTLLVDLASSPPEWVWFEGGEVTMDEKSRALLLDALSIGRRAGVKSRINTNAQKCTPAVSRRLARAGLSFACVSCDSVDPALFSRMRGLGPSKVGDTFAEFAKNVQGLVDTGITVDLEVTLTRYNISELEAVYDFAESFGAKNVMMGLQFLVATTDDIFALYPGFDAQYRALTGLIERAERGSVPVRICCSPLVPCRYPDLYLPREKVIWVGCSCGYDYVHIHATGDVFLCGFWDHSQPIGNLLEASLPEIWRESPLRWESQRTVPCGCKACSYWKGALRCHNTCFSVAHRKTGGFDTDAYLVTERNLKDYGA